MKKKLLLVFILVLSVMSDEYLSQESIDREINNAYYAFVAASSDVGQEYTQESAIENAKSVIKRLEKLAENDPNRRYILFKISDLQDQITLEEEEVSLKAQFERVNEINRLVKIFNDELFKKRPSFSKLHILLEKVDGVSRDHRNQFATNINQKNRVVVSELRSEIKNKFSRNNYEEAETLYHYAVRNRKYLNFSENDYELWSGKIQAKRNAEFLQENIDKSVQYLEKITKEDKISEARRNIDVLRHDINGASQHLPTKFVSSTFTRLNRLQNDVDRRENELVERNLALIKGANTDAALQYMNNTLRTSGVNPEKIAQVDRAILQAGGVKKIDNRAVAADIASMGTSNNYASMDDIKSKMKIKSEALKQHKIEVALNCKKHFESSHKKEIKARNKAYAKSNKNRIKADKILDKIGMLIAYNYHKKAISVLQKKQPFLFEYSTPQKYYEVKKQLNGYQNIPDHKDGEIKATLAKIQKENGNASVKEEEAMNITVEIYTALEKRDVEGAYSLYYYNENLLSENSYIESYNSLKKIVNNDYDGKYLK